jgi:hypothetical protein
MEKTGVARLSKRQRALAEYLAHSVSRGEGRLASSLLIGAEGVGKRTIAGSAAQLLGKEFVELSVAGSPEPVLKLLFGDTSEAERARADHLPPGEIGRASSSLVYLSGLERADPSLLGRLHALIARRTYLDALGTVWRTSADTLLVAALTFPADLSPINPGHWIANVFDCRIPVEPPRHVSELFEIGEEIVRDHGAVLEPSVQRILQTILQSRHNLHTLRRWLERACIEAAVTGRLGEREIRSALLGDLSWLLERTPYRGIELQQRRLEQWLNQFPDDLQGLALHLVQCIGNHYYISAAQFHDGLARLIGRTGIRQGQEVIFCRWQAEGDSAAHMAHLIKTQAGWRNYAEVNLYQEQRYWPRIDRGARHEIIIVDDFAGSGGTLLKLFDGPISRLLTVFRNARLWILVLAGFDHGLREVRRRARPFGGRLQFAVDRVFADKDRCFTPTSEVLPDSHQRERLKEFCNDVAQRHMPGLRKDLILGYRDSGALVVFYEWVPNNTLPIFWYDSDTWQSLFPRSGLATKT